MDHGVVVYDSFDAGDWGDRLDDENAPAGTFSALNLMVYETGLLGPRPGLVRLADLPAGAPRAIALSNVKLIGGGIAGIVMMSTGYAWRFNADNGAALLQCDGAADTTPVLTTVGLYPDPGTSDVYVAIPGQRLFKVQVEGLHLVAIDDAPHGRVIARSGVRLIVGGDPAHPNRLYYSGSVGDAADSSWDALQYEPIGDPSAITALYEIKSALLVGKQTGWIAVQGLGQDQPRATPVSQQPGPTVAAAQGRAGSELVGYVAADGAPIARLFDGTTATKLADRRFEGTTPYPLPPAEVDGTAPSMSVVRAARDGLLFAVRDPNGDPNTATWLYDGRRWTRHLLPVNLGHWTSPQFHQVFPQVSDQGYPHDYVWATGATADPSPLYRLRVGGVTRPGQAGSVILGDVVDSGSPAGMSNSVKFPAWRHPEGKLVQVRSVTFDIDRWNTGGSHPRAMTLSVQVLGRYKAGSLFAPQGNDYQEALTEAEGPYVHIQGCKTGWGNGFQIRLDDLVGVAIRKIVVNYDVKASPGGAGGQVDPA